MSKPQLCVTVTAGTTAELRRRRDAIADADMVELRLDSVADPDAAGALADRRRPVIVTCRPVWEGGRFAGSEEDRKRLLADAIAGGAEYVDIEWRAGFDDLIARAASERVVLSNHDFTGVPPDLESRLRAMRCTGVKTIKLAVQTSRLSDCVRLRDLAAAAGDSGTLVVIGMGDHGFATRAMPGRFGSAWTYAGALRAVGQVSAQSILDDYRFRSIGPATRLYGVVGGSISHSVSPAMHNASFGALGIDAVYLPLPAVSADDFVSFGRAFGISGASVTIPHKVALFDRVDEVDPVARSIGAINTIRASDGRWIGGNTDASGFLQPLDEHAVPRNVRAAVLGAGGAARAVAVALAARGCPVRLHARTRARAEQVAAVASADVGAWPPESGSWDLLVNCTPIGQHPHADETPVPMGQLTGRYVYDLVYNPSTTRLLREAAAAGCETIGGLEMLVAQAREQFQWWTGAKAPAAVMRDAALKRLAESSRDENHLV
jgi:3-dehydroquinate dehydratase/shikimate dehydrogenase